MLALLVPVLLVAGCKNRDCDDRPAPADAPSDTSGYALVEARPDILILSVSGHAAAATAITCQEVDNRAYLADDGDAVEEIRGVFVDHGLSVVVRSFSDRLQAPDLDDDEVPDAPDELGFVELLRILDQAYALWIENTTRPTRIVLVAHSHGGNWAHIATGIRPEIPIEYLVTLDGVITRWECEHECNVSNWVAKNNYEFDFNISQPRREIPVVGEDLPQHVKDVVFPNVRYNLEIQSTGPLPLNDCCDNIRPTGSLDGIFTEALGDSHSRCHLADSDSMNWVVAKIDELEL